MAAANVTSPPEPAAASPSPLVKFAKDVIAGTAGGLAVVAVGHPFDTVKVRLQTQSSTNPLYSGALDCARKTVQWEGVSGLYKGVLSPLVGQMFFRATLFSAFGASKRWLAQNADGSPRDLTVTDYYAAGAMTGFAAAFVEGPIDFYKSQVQVQIIRSRADPKYKPPFTNMTDCVRSTLRANAFKGPFQGLGATLVRNVPANSIYLGSFEVLKDHIARWQGIKKTELGGLEIVTAGGLGGMAYWVVIFPVDVVKSAMQTDAIVKVERKYPDMLTTTQKLWAEGGVGRFYRGFSPALLRAIPANGIMLLVVDKMGVLLNKVM